MTLADAKAALFADAFALQSAGRPEEAVAIYQELVKTGLTVNLARNLGLALYDLGRHADAEHWMSLAARNRAGDAEIRNLLGVIQAARGEVNLAELEFRTALALRPDFATARLALADLFLSVGRYQEGWPLLESRIALRPDVVPPGPTGFPEWRGEPLAGKSILVWYEQGFGDQIQMCRFATELKTRGASRVTLCCRPPLAALLAGVEGVDAVAPVAQGAIVSVERHDYWSRYFSLPGPLGVTLEALPAKPYLRAPEDRREQWRGFEGVGLCWRSSATGFNAGNKNLTPDDAKRLLDFGMTSLHPEDTGAKDFADTAAIMERLDLVVTIDTSVAHLAGAMGVPCWTMLPYVRTDWRWLRQRSDSPWYPSMKLYRQSKPRDWTSVLDAVTADLANRELDGAPTRLEIG